MKRRLVLSYVLLVTIALVLFTVPVALSSSQLLERTLENTARREADVFVPLLLRTDPAAEQAIRDRTRDFEEATGSRVRLVQEGVATDDAQVREALRGREPEAVWGRNELLDTESVSVVVPVKDDGRTVAAVQVVAPADDVRAEIAGIWRFRLGVGALVLVVAAGLAVALGSGLSRPLRRLDVVARRLGEGDFSARADETGPREVASLGRTLNSTARRTEVLLASQRSFVADASHQLRTPLTAMRLALDNVRETTTDVAVADRLAAVEQETLRMGRIVEGLLDLARAEARTGDRGAVDVGELVSERVAIWAAAFEDADVRCRVEIRRPGLALVSEGSVEQTLDNLLDNALTVSSPGSSIDVAVGATTTHVQVTLRDHGPGMDAEARARAFDRFWTTRPGVGSGLGLSVVRELVEHDGGTVTLEDPPDTGGGLRVVIRWPRAGD